MTEERRGPEPTGKKEILDLKTHGAVYGRFLLAGTIEESRLAEMIDPDKTIEVDFPTDAKSLGPRNYNPVFANLSSGEREEEWKDKKFTDAYSQWRTRFAEHMKNIKDPKRALALKTLFPDKEAADFSENDSDTLFQEFSQKKSDVTKFTNQTIANISKGGKVDAQVLAEMLPHLEWLASGLFGKQTATMVTRLIELESELHNDPQAVLENLKLNKARINTLQTHEQAMLKILHLTLPRPQNPKPADDDKGDEKKRLKNELPAAPVQTSSSATAESVTPQPAAEPVTKTKEPVSQPKPDQAARSVPEKTADAKENIIVLKGKGDLAKELNEKLKQNQDSNVIFSIPRNEAQKFISSIAGGQIINPGTLSILAKNVIEISELNVDTMIRGIGKITFDLRLENDPNGGLTATGWAKGMRKYLIQPFLNGELEKINPEIKKKLDLQIAKANPEWESGAVSIDGDRVNIRFTKTRKPPTQK